MCYRCGYVLLMTEFPKTIFSPRAAKAKLDGFPHFIFSKYIFFCFFAIFCKGFKNNYCNVSFSNSVNFLWVW